MTINNKIKGIEIDFWRLINKKLKLEANFEIENKNKVLIEKIKNSPNKIKFAYSDYDYNDKLYITETISKIKIAIATLNNKPFISSIDELAGKKVAINKYSTYYNKLKKEFPNINFIEVLNIKEGLKLLTEGKIYASIDKLPALSYDITQGGLTNIKISGTIGKPFKIRLLVNKKNPLLLNILNKVITSISHEEISDINNKYYSVIYQTSVDYSWVYKVVMPLVIIILIIVITNRKLKNEIKKRKEIEKELHEIVNIDVLTNINNRRKIESLYNFELERSKRYKRDLSVIFFDIDDFKLINDQLGHKIGDEVLIKLCKLISKHIRKTDYLGRWGGEEFVIVLPETNKKDAQELAYNLRDKIINFDFKIDRKITCSFGVSQFEENDNSDTLITRVDNAMYEVKRSGKNEVKVV